MEKEEGGQTPAPFPLLDVVRKSSLSRSRDVEALRSLLLPCGGRVEVLRAPGTPADAAALSRALRELLSTAEARGANEANGR